MSTGHCPKIWQTEWDGITGCAVAQHCCNDDQQSQWENGDFDPSPRRSETPENFITKIGHSALHSVISFVMML